MSVPEVFSFKVPKKELVTGLFASYMESELSRVATLSVTFISTSGKKNETLPDFFHGYYLVTFVPTLHGIAHMFEDSLQDGLLKNFSQYSIT